MSAARRRARRWPRLATLLVAGGLAACELDEVAVPVGTPRPVVHLVLNPQIGIRIPFRVLLERTLTGRVNTSERSFDPENPIVTGGGDPITGARVEIRDLTTGLDSAVAIDLTENRTDDKYRGVYEFENSSCGPFHCPDHGITLVRGRTYAIRVTTPNNEVVTGVTTIPSAVARPDTGLRRVFNAETDTYVFSWPAAEGLRRYALQLETPYGPFQVFTAAESLAVSGALRNFQQDRFPRVFVPGFLQGLHAFAVDPNYYDYYRSSNNHFTGEGLVSRLEGGSGLFGAMIPIRFQAIDVVAPFDEPVDGEWTLEGADDPRFPPRLTTWADGAYASGKLIDVYDPEFGTRRGVLGTRSGNRLRLAVLRYQTPRDTAWTLDAEVRGDTLFTMSPVKGPQRWRRAATTP